LTASPSNPPKSLKNPYLARPSSLAPAGRASAAAAGAAAGSALGNGAAVGVGEEDGNGPRSVVAVAVFAGDRRIGILDRAQDVEAGFAVQTNVFVKRHRNILNPEYYRVNRRLYLFKGYLVLVCKGFDRGLVFIHLIFLWEKPVDVAAIVTNQAIRRYVCPVEFEEGGQGSV
jgi:hypothetical protein